MNLIKTAEIEPGKNYLFAAYPHNIAPFSAIPNFCSDANEFEKLFPGIEANVCVASHLLRNPITRELFLAIGGYKIFSKSSLSILNFTMIYPGMREASENSLRYVLENECSKALVLYPGGAKELRYIETGTDNYIILANCRKGFVRIALSTGYIIINIDRFFWLRPPALIFDLSIYRTPLVPVFSFGETYPYDKIHFCKSPRIVDKIPVRVVRSVFSDTLFFWNGRGIFQTNFGLMPRRHPINTIGKSPTFEIRFATCFSIITHRSKKKLQTATRN